MRVLLIGHGAWGSRIRAKLETMDGVLLSGVYDERAEALPTGSVFGVRSLDGFLDVMRPEAVIIATPPSPHGARLQLVDKLLEYGVQRIRVEKPAALSVAEAESMITACALNDAQLTVGYTLLHHPLYESAFSYLRLSGCEVRSVDAVRIGRRPVHRVDAMCDLGTHAASVAAYLMPSQGAAIHAEYHPERSVRRTTIGTTDGAIIVDEVSGVVDTPNGVLTVRPAGDALERDLRAWVTDTHRGVPRVALETQRIIEQHMLQIVNAA